MKIAIDCANGAGYNLDQNFKSLELSLWIWTSNGFNINKIVALCFQIELNF